MAKKAGVSEHDAQVRVIRWAKLREDEFPELALLFAIPNGGMRNKIVAARMKAEGVKRGVPDLFLPVKRNGWCGLFIEMKVGTNKASEEQQEYMLMLTEQHFLCVICYGAEDAIRTISWYIEG